MWIILMAELGLVIFLVSIACLALILPLFYYCIHRVLVKALILSVFARNKAPEPKKEAIVTHIIEENKKRWLEKQAEVDGARLNEQDNRPYAKVLQFPQKL